MLCLLLLKIERRHCANVPARLAILSSPSQSAQERPRGCLPSSAYRLLQCHRRNVSPPAMRRCPPATRRCPPLQKAVRRSDLVRNWQRYRRGITALPVKSLPVTNWLTGHAAMPHRIADVNGVVMIPIFRRDLGHRHFVLDLGDARAHKPRGCYYPSSSGLQGICS